MLQFLANRLNHRDDRERGAVLIISTAGFALAVICAAIAVDLGRLVHDNRRMQNVADLAALDAVRAFDDPGATRGLVWALAADSARRNGYEPVATGHTFTVELGNFTNHAFVFGATATSGDATPVGAYDTVRVKTRNFVDWLLQPGNGHSDGVGVASKGGVVDFSVGSSLASLSTQDANLLNPILTRLLGASTAIDLDAVSYTGLVNGGITLGSLQQELLDMDLAVGTPEELLSSDLVAADVYQATANALRNDGQVAAANALDVIAARMNQSMTMKLSDAAVVDSGNGSVLDTTINAFDFVTGNAMVMNGSTQDPCNAPCGSVVNVPNLAVTIPNVTSIGLSMNIGEGKRFCWRCPVGKGVTTQQITTTLNAVVRLPLGVLGALVTVSLPLNFGAAEGQGTVSSVENCGIAGQRAGIAAHSEGATVDQTVSLNVLGIGLVNLHVLMPLAEGNGTLMYEYTADFSPPTGTSPGQAIGASTIDLSNAQITGVSATVRNALSTILGNISTAVLNRVNRLLGLSIANAEIQALDMDCVQPKLVA
jgi:uncharacterized membrane protein